MRSLEAGARSIRSGNSFLIFPEATRRRTGELLPSKKGRFLLAPNAHAPLLPVALSGATAAPPQPRGPPPSSQKPEDIARR